MVIAKSVYQEHIEALVDFDFEPTDSDGNPQYRAPATAEIERHLRKHGIEYQKKTFPAPANADQHKQAKLEAVKRWFHDDWQRIEPKLRTSIVEGISD